MKVVLFVVSDNMAIDVRSNNVSIFTLIEEVTAPIFPILIHRLTVTAIFSREQTEPETTTFHLRAGMGDKILFETPFPIEFQGRSRARSVVEIGGVAVQGPGVIEFRLMKDGEFVESWNVDVIRGNVDQPELALAGAVQVNPPQAL